MNGASTLLTDADWCSAAPRAVGHANSSNGSAARLKAAVAGVHRRGVDRVGRRCGHPSVLWILQQRTHDDWKCGRKRVKPWRKKYQKSSMWESNILAQGREIV